MNNITLPDYDKESERLFDLIVNKDIGHAMGVAEIKEALIHAQRVGDTLGYQKGYSMGQTIAPAPNFKPDWRK